LTGIKNDEEVDADKKHYNIIKRRLENGQCFRTPCLGCSEFPVKKIELVDDFDMTSISSEILQSGDTDLGFMCYEVKFDDGGEPVNGDWENPKFSDRASAVYYRPHMIDGVIEVGKYMEGLKC
jgi:CRISPR-associated protein Cas5d